MQNGPKFAYGNGQVKVSNGWGSEHISTNITITFLVWAVSKVAHILTMR